MNENQRHVGRVFLSVGQDHPGLQTNFRPQPLEVDLRQVHPRRLPILLLALDAATLTAHVPSNTLMGDFDESVAVVKSQTFLSDESSASSHPVHIGLKCAKGVCPRVAR